MRIKPKIHLVPEKYCSADNPLDFLGYTFGPLRENFSKAVNKFIKEKNIDINAYVSKGSCGEDIYYDIQKFKDLSLYPSVVCENGFNEFFTPEFKKRFYPEKDRKSKDFIEIYDYSDKNLNNMFKNADLKDPKGIYNIFSGMPYVMLINKNKLQGIKIPRTWKDLLNPCYKNLIAMGHSKKQLNEIVLFDIYKNYGSEGIYALSENCGQIMHTLELIKAAAFNSTKCGIFIVPYFFAKAAPHKAYLKIVWPEDGAVMCPMYLIVKKDCSRNARKAADFILGKEFGNILSNMHFPHINAPNDKDEFKNRHIRFAGWNYFDSIDILKEAEKIENIWNS